MVQNYYKYLDKLRKLNEENPYALPLLGIITEFFNKRQFDYFDLHIRLYAICDEGFNHNKLLKTLKDLSSIGILYVVENTSDEYSKVYRSQITFYEFRLIRFKICFR